MCIVEYQSAINDYSTLLMITQIDQVLAELQAY